MKNKILIGLAIVIFVVAAIYVLKPEQKEPEPQVNVPANVTYASSSLKVALTYPDNFKINEGYVYEQFSPKLIYGVKFSVPEEMTKGTNLSSDSGISVESLPRAKNCTGEIYIPDDVKASKMTENGIEYSVATTSGAGAGNFYEEIVYAYSTSSPCTALRYFIHSGNIGNYPPEGEEGSVTEFNKSELLGKFDDIRRSVRFTGE